MSDSPTDPTMSKHGWTMDGYPFDTFGTKHLAYLAGAVLVCWAVIRIGRRRPDPRFRWRVSLALILFSLGQELADDILRVLDGTWTVRNDLPLHLCSLGMLLSVYALATRRQLGVNRATGANYFFLLEKPGGNSPFLMGSWPWYLLGFEVLAVTFFLLLFLPMWWVERRERGTVAGEA